MNDELNYSDMNWCKYEITRLREQVTALTKERDELQFSFDAQCNSADKLFDQLAAGATVPYKSNDVFTFTYNIIEFDWDKEIDGLLVTMHPRAWNAQRTCFEADDKRLGGKDPNFRLACPSFRKGTRPDTHTVAQPADALVAEESACFVAPTIEMIPMESLEGELQSMTPIAEGYETARLRFFRDLLEGERLRILVELDALSENFDERMSLGLERRLFDMLVRTGKLGAVEKMIDQLIDERKDGTQ